MLIVSVVCVCVLYNDLPPPEGGAAIDPSCLPVPKPPAQALANFNTRIKHEHVTHAWYQTEGLHVCARIALRSNGAESVMACANKHRNRNKGGYR